MFYLIYYTCLTGYFLAMLLIFYQTLDYKEPKWLQDDGIIGNNPGKRRVFSDFSWTNFCGAIVTNRRHYWWATEKSFPLAFDACTIIEGEAMVSNKVRLATLVQIPGPIQRALSLSLSLFGSAILFYPRFHGEGET